MANHKTVKVAARDFVSLGEKLSGLHSTLSSGEAAVFDYLIESAAIAAAQWPPPPWLTPQFKFATPLFKYKPRGGSHLVTGALNGLTVVIKARGRLIVVKPEGPLPTESGLLGAIPITG